MGGVVQSVENAGQDVVNAVSNIGTGIDNTVRSAVPGGWGTIGAATIAAITMNPELLGAGLDSATTSMIASDAQGMAAQGLSSSQISQALAQSYGIDSSVADSVAGDALSTQSAITTAASPTYTGASIPSTVSPSSSILSDSGITLQNAATDATGAAAGSGIGGTASTALKTLGTVGLINSILGGNKSTGTTGTTGGGTTASTVPETKVTLPTTGTINQLAMPAFSQIQSVPDPTLIQAGSTSVPNIAATTSSTPTADQYINTYLANQQLQEEFPTATAKALYAAKSAKKGGIMRAYAVGGPVMQANNLNAVGVNPMYPQSGIAPMTTMNNPNNIPVSNDILRKSNIYDPYTGSQRLATGGIAQGIGGYSDGGQLLKGPGDGMSDDIPAKIGEHQPARLADGEFVVPADVVSHLGNGSTDAGAKQLYAMLDRVRKARTGNHKQGKQIKAQKFLPK